MATVLFVKNYLTSCRKRKTVQTFSIAIFASWNFFETPELNPKIYNSEQNKFIHPILNVAFLLLVRMPSS